MENSVQNWLQLKVANVISRAAAYLLLNLSMLGSALAARVQSNEVEITDGEVVHYFNATSTATGIIKVLGNESVLGIGSSDFDKGKLTDDRAICYDRVELHYAGSSASDITKTGTYTPHMYAIDGTARFTGNLLNSVFKLYVNNKPVIVKQLSEMVNSGREYQSTNIFGEVAIPKIIKPDTQVRAEIELPTGTAVGGSNTHYFKLVLKGAVTAVSPGK